MPDHGIFINGYQLKGGDPQFRSIHGADRGWGGSSSWSISMPSPRQSPCGISACRSLTKAIRQRF